MPWWEKDNPGKEHVTVWTVFPGSTKYFEPSQAAAGDFKEEVAEFKGVSTGSGIGVPGGGCRCVRRRKPLFDSTVTLTIRQQKIQQSFAYLFSFTSDLPFFFMTKTTFCNPSRTVVHLLSLNAMIALGVDVCDPTMAEAIVAPLKSVPYEQVPVHCIRS